jgi:hypothetical protein
MEFTETQAEILVNAWALSSRGCGQVLMPWAYPDAIELAEAGWLERRSEDDGPSTWWWTPEAEAALDLNALTESVKGREN